jgi:hypothetical protein
VGIVKFLCSAKSGDERPERNSGQKACGVWSRYIPVMASYDDGTCPRLFTLLDEIRFGETLPFVCRLELLSEIVVTDATGVDH